MKRNTARGAQPAPARYWHACHQPLLRTVLAIAIAFGMTTTACAQSLKAGAYDVTFELKLPNLDGAMVPATKTICIKNTNDPPHLGLRVLSENNPLATCATSDFKVDGSTLTFAITCEGGNAAKATAKYILAGTRFEGRINMNMGGKNMTMSEFQTGVRRGPCTALKKRPS